MHRRYEQFLVLFYNTIAEKEVETFEQIPQSAKDVLSYMGYHDIVAPLVLKFIAEGGICEAASNRFGVIEGFACQRRREVGRFKRNNR